MKYVNLGSSGLKVSRIALGCMTYGEPLEAKSGGSHAWALDENASRPLIKLAVESGITFFDTANAYSQGVSERVVGRALRDYAKREEVVVATKVYFPVRGGANAQGLSRKAILTEIDASLERLGMDYVDLYQIHRYDPETPIEETLEALHDVVKAGKARYIGASSMYAWQFCKALDLADRHGWTRFVSMQNHLNLLYREEEREMLGLCRAEGIGVIPWSPLARGRLARPWEVEPTTKRGATDTYGTSLYDASERSDREIVDRTNELAGRRGVPPARIALAWLVHDPVVTAPIVGASKPKHIEDAVAALDLDLTPDEIAFLEEPYVPHRIAGFS